MSDALVRAQNDYGAVVELEGAAESSFGRDNRQAMKRVGAVLLFTTIGCVALFGFYSSDSAYSKKPWLADAELPHFCPQWPLYCHQHPLCLDHFQEGEASNPVTEELCPDYVADCKNYCRECDCVRSSTDVNRGDKFCDGLLDSCLYPEKYFKEPAELKDEVLACPFGYLQVGVNGAGVSGDTIDTALPETVGEGFVDIVDCSDWCSESDDCNAFTYYRGSVDQKFVCRRYASTTADILEDPSQIMCKPTTGSAATILNPNCEFTVAGTFYQQTDVHYPACAAGSTFFGLDQGGFCCSGTCAKGEEGDDADDVICAVLENPTPNGYDECTDYQWSKFCMWAAGAKSGYDTSTWSDYTVKVSMSVNGPGAAGVLFRMTTPSDQDSPRYWLKFQPRDPFREMNETYHTLMLSYVEGDKEEILSDERWFFSPETVCEADNQVNQYTASNLAECKTSCLGEQLCGGIIYDPEASGTECTLCTFGGEARTMDVTAGQDFFKRPGTYAQTWTNENCDGDPDATVFLTGSSEPQCEQCFDTCSTSSASAFQSVRLFGPGMATTGDKCIGTDDPDAAVDGNVNTFYAETLLGAGFLDTGGAFGEADGCTPVGNNMLGPWSAVDGHAVVLCSGEVVDGFKGDLSTVCPISAIEPEEDLDHFKEGMLYDVEIIAENYVFTVNVDKKTVMTIADDRLASGSVGLQTWKMNMIAHSLQLLNSRGVPLMTTYAGRADFACNYELFVDGARAYSGEANDPFVNLRFDSSTSTIAVKLKISTSTSKSDAVILNYQDMERLSSVYHAFPSYVNYLIATFPDALIGNSMDSVDAFTAISSSDSEGKLMTNDLVWKFTASFCEDVGQQWYFKAGVDFSKGGQMFVDDQLVSVEYKDLDWKQKWTNTDGVMEGKIFLDPGKHDLAVFGMDKCCGGANSFAFRRGSSDKWLEFSVENLMPICETQGFEKFVIAAETTASEDCSAASLHCKSMIAQLQDRFPDMEYQELAILSERGLTAENYLTATSVQQYLFDFDSNSDCARPCIDILPKMVSGYTPDGLDGWVCKRTNEAMAPEDDGTDWFDADYDRSDWAAPKELDDYVETAILEHTSNVQPKWVGVDTSSNALSGLTAYVGCFQGTGLTGVTLVKTWDYTAYTRAHAPENCRTACRLTDYYAVGTVAVGQTSHGFTTASGYGVACYCVESYDAATVEADETVCGSSIEIDGLGDGDCSADEDLDSYVGPQWCVDGGIDTSIALFRESYDTTYCVYSFVSSE